MAPTGEAVLDLRDGGATRPFITIAGERFEMRLRSELSIEETLVVAARMKALEGVDIDSLDPSEIASVMQDLRRAVALVTIGIGEYVEGEAVGLVKRLIRWLLRRKPGATGVLASLTDGECVAIVEAFNRVLGEKATTTAPTGTSSRASRRSTAARRKK